MKTIWDPKPLNALASIPLSDRIRLLGQLLDSTKEHFQAINASLSSGNGETLRDIAHPLKSASASLGALWLSDHAARLETMAENADLAAARALWSEGQQERDLSLKAMEEALAELTSSAPADTP